MLHRLVSLAGLLALILLATPVAASAARAPGPALHASPRSLAHALSCRGRLAGARRDPVLLVHGTFADSAINWSWNYEKALPARGEPTCAVDLPGRAAGDIQASTEYVVSAIRAMAQRSGRRVALVTHSQGGLEARWALRWWPDLRHLVSDVITLAAPNQGSAFPDAVCGQPSVCAAALYQMRTGSAFLTALNRGRQTIPGVPFTAIITNDDRVFVLPRQQRLHGPAALATNIAVQDLCPGHQAQHNDLPFDGPAYAIALDALDHAGPAKLSRIGHAAGCRRDTMPGVTRAEGNAKLQSYTSTLVGLLGPHGPKARGEPRVARYARG